MAKKSAIAKAAKRVTLVLRAATKRAECRQKAKNVNVDYDERMAAQVDMGKMKRDTSPSRVRRRCGICGRPRGVYRKFGLCRLHLRKALMNGLVPGARKASW